MGDKVKTVIASILKPIDDTRMYEKFGFTLRQTNRYEVNIIGFTSKNPPQDNKIRFYSIFNFNSTSIKRWLASLTYFVYLIRIKPKLIIVTTFELLPSTIFYKIIHSNVRIVYDIQENYALNFLSNRNKSYLTKMVGFIIRAIEHLSQRYVDLNILAELTYAKELSFLDKPVEFIQNKFKVVDLQHITLPSTLINIAEKSELVFILNGTISKNYGIYETLAYAKELSMCIPKLLLIVVGHVTEVDLYQYLRQYEQQNSHVYCYIDTSPISHSILLKAVELADFGIIAHRLVDSIKDCFPTRIYEYMAFRKPFILQDNPLWTTYCQDWQCSIPVDFSNFNIQEVLSAIKNTNFYPNGVSQQIYWDSEAKKLIEAIDSTNSTKH